MFLSIETGYPHPRYRFALQIRIASLILFERNSPSQSLNCAGNFVAVLGFAQTLFFRLPWLTNSHDFRRRIGCEKVRRRQQGY
jgi:hypothetical protein